MSSSDALPLPAASDPTVFCLCAAWCGTCREYADTFATVAAHFPQVRFEWIDIEDDERFAEVDIESFPTVAITRDGQRLFEGVLLPHAQHLKRLVETLLSGPESPSGSLTKP